MLIQDTKNSREHENKDFIVVNDELLEHVFIKRSYREIIIIRDNIYALCRTSNQFQHWQWRFHSSLFSIENLTFDYLSTFAKALLNTTFTKTREILLFCTRFTCIWIKCVFVISTWKRWTSLRSFFTYIRKRI